jgi:hypothetical protein
VTSGEGRAIMNYELWIMNYELWIMNYRAVKGNEW